MQPREVNAPEAPPVAIYYSQAIEVSSVTRTLYISGQVGVDAGLFNAQYMTRMARIALMPPKAMRCRPSETL